MTADRSQRNRELIEASAALLAADYPLDVLMEQLCRAIARAMNATVAVALPNEDGTMRLYSIDDGDRFDAGDLLMPQESRIAAVFRSGRARLMLDAAAEGEAPYDVESAAKSHLPVRSAMYVPVAYGDVTIGVLSVQHPEPSQFNRDDLRIVDSMARHLAIAIRNQRTVAATQQSRRVPRSLVAGLTSAVALGGVATLVWAGQHQRDAYAGGGLVTDLIAAVVVLSLCLLALVTLMVLSRAYSVRSATAGAQQQRAELKSEIVDRIDMEEQLRAAYHDTLTGLPNRTFFLNQLRDVLEQRRINAGAEYAVLFIDLDRFYVVNDSLGHAVGDQLLAAIAYRLEETIPPHALIARLGGDEFALLLPAQQSAVQEAIAIAEDVLEALRNPFRVGEREVYSGASIGIVKIDDGYVDSETILRDADISMFHAKRSGRARYAVFDQTMRERVTQQLELEGSLRGAVDRGEIVAYYQPIVRLDDESIVGFEALARWHRDGEAETVAAGDFVPVAEQTGMMRAIDAELFAQVCRDASELIAIAPAIRVSVNVSANDLTRASLLADIDSTLERFSVPASAFRIEITETAVMEDAERALAMLGELRARDLEIVIDDFGAGYSSLSYLQRLPVSGVKIDRSFIAALPGNDQALEIVRAVVALAKTLGLQVTAEGVEREEQFELLRLLGIDFAQGYWFSPPVNFETVKTFFAVRS